MYVCVEINVRMRSRIDPFFVFGGEWEGYATRMMTSSRTERDEMFRDTCRGPGARARGPSYISRQVDVTVISLKIRNFSFLTSFSFRYEKQTQFEA
jgi:hypothetical protein